MSYEQQIENPPDRKSEAIKKRYEEWTTKLTTHRNFEKFPNAEIPGKGSLHSYAHYLSNRAEDGNTDIPLADEEETFGQFYRLLEDEE